MESTPAENGSQIIHEVGKLIEGLSFEDYKKAEGINAGGLKEFLKSAAHYYEARYNRIEKKDTDALVFGKLLHFAVLEPVLFQENYIVKPKFDMRTKIGKEECKIWEATLKPKSIVVPEKFITDLIGCSKALMAHPVASNLLETGVRETTLFWKDEVTGETSKCRPDFITAKGFQVDLKSTKDAREEYFAKDILKYGYHITAAHYCEGARVTKTSRSDQYIFLAIEKTAPYQIAIYPAGNSVLGVGEQWRAKLMRDYAKCKKTNTWPGYNPTAKVIELPSWAEAVDPDEDEEIEE